MNNEKKASNLIYVFLLDIGVIWTLIRMSPMLSLLAKYIHGQGHLVIFGWIVPRSWRLLQPPDVTSIYFINYEWLHLSDPLLELWWLNNSGACMPGQLVYVFIKSSLITSPSDVDRASTLQDSCFFRCVRVWSHVTFYNWGALSFVASGSIFWIIKL